MYPRSRYSPPALPHARHGTAAAARGGPETAGDGSAARAGRGRETATAGPGDGTGDATARRDGCRSGRPALAALRARSARFRHPAEQ